MFSITDKEVKVAFEKWWADIVTNGLYKTLQKDDAYWVWQNACWFAYDVRREDIKDKLLYLADDIKLLAEKV